MRDVHFWITVKYAIQIAVTHVSNKRSHEMKNTDPGKSMFNMCFLIFFIDVTLPTDDVEDMILKLRQLLSKGKSEQDFMDSTLSLSSMSINSKNVTTGRSVMHALGLKVSISHIEKKNLRGRIRYYYNINLLSVCYCVHKIRTFDCISSQNYRPILIFFDFL